MYFLKLLLQIFTSFGGLLFGVSKMDDWCETSLGLVLLYWFVFIVVNFIVAVWRMQETGYNLKSDIRHGFKIVKKCPKCRNSLPSYFTNKCPYCIADLS
jgi:hypothetical protein